MAAAAKGPADADFQISLFLHAWGAASLAPRTQAAYPALGGGMKIIALFLGCGESESELDPEVLARLVALEHQLAVAESTAARQEAELVALELELAKAQENQVCDEWLRSVMTLEGDTLTLTGVNLRLESGDPDGLPNGLGNLIIGANEAEGSEVRTGSHNLVIGPYHSWSGQYSVVSGVGNAVLANGAVAMGGRGNRVEGDEGVVIAGEGGTALDRGVVIGGKGNFAEGGAVAIGGEDLIACGELSAAIGGLGGQARGWGALVLGGQGALASGPYSVVVGGVSNTAAGNFAQVVGGRGNVVDEATWFGSILGGESNTVVGHGADPPFSATLVGGFGGRVGSPDGEGGVGAGLCAGGWGGSSSSSPLPDSANSQYATLVGAHASSITAGWYVVEVGG